MKYSLQNLIQLARTLPNQSNSPPSTLINRFIPRKISPHYSRHLTPPLAKTSLVEPFDNSASISPVALEKNFCLKKKAYVTFPPDITNSTTREVISRFQVNIENVVKYIDHVCCCCS